MLNGVASIIVVGLATWRQHHTAMCPTTTHTRPQLPDDAGATLGLAAPERTS